MREKIKGSKFGILALSAIIIFSLLICGGGYFLA